jgi:hypothetical protein
VKGHNNKGYNEGWDLTNALEVLGGGCHVVERLDADGQQGGAAVRTQLYQGAD